jgi:hypothetical protein
MSLSCDTSQNAIANKCSKCGAMVVEVHKAGGTFRKALFCWRCCPVHSPRPAAAPVANPEVNGASPWGPPRRPDGSYYDPADDAFYRDAQRRSGIHEHSLRGEARWIPRRHWFRGRR